MANEPLLLSEILDRVLDEADFDAAHAALMSTESGRAFLAEYARRNRHADTQTVVSALARVEAAVRGDPAPQFALALPDIASEIERIADELAVSQMGDDISVAIERIHDVAFMLHERTVEQSLRDAFDDAIRKLSDALTQPAGIVERGQQAAVQLRAIAARLQGSAAPLPDVVQPLPAVNIDQQSASETVATFAGSPAGDSNPAPEVDLTVDPQAFSEEQLAVEVIDAAELPADIAPIEDVSPVENVVEAVNGAGEVSEASPDLPKASESVLEQAFDSDAFVRSAALSQNPSSVLLPPQQAPHDNASVGEPVNDQLLPSDIYVQDVVVGPEEDPGDLFEPMPMPSPVSALAVSEEGALEPDSSQERANIAPATHSVPLAAASDPLAAVRDLSEEELIALFS
jgi:hypothetical protein